MSFSNHKSINELVERRVDKLFSEFFTDCPVGRKSVSGCPALGSSSGSKSPHLSSNYAAEFFTQCPYGKRATAECPYGKEILEKAQKDKVCHGHAHTSISGKTPEYATEFFTECPYGRRSAEQCPYGHEILERAHKKILNAHHGHDQAKSSGYAEEFFTECPYGKKVANQCPYGQEILDKADKKTTHHHHHGKHSNTVDYAKEFFTECPYGKKIADQCPYGHEILEKAHNKESASGHHHHGISSGSKNEHSADYYMQEFFTECPYGKKVAGQCPYGHEILEKANKSHHRGSSRNNNNHPDYVDEFFFECPYGKKAAEECPYGHRLLEKAGVEVPPLKKHDEESVKCPFASLASPGDKCPVSGATNDNTASATTAGKCPVGGVLPQSEKCPVSPNYKKPFTPVVDSYETDDDFKFFVELPGVSKSDIKLDVKDRVLILSGQVKASAEETKGNVRFTERTLGAFSRTILLHNNVSVDKIEAKLENGVLCIIVPKGVPSIKKSITVN